MFPTGKLFCIVTKVVRNVVFGKWNKTPENSLIRVLIVVPINRDNNGHLYTTVLQVYDCLIHTNVTNNKCHPANIVAINNTSHQFAHYYRFTLNRCHNNY